MEKLWCECSKAEHEDVNKLNRRILKLKKFISLNYLTENGKEYFRKELLKEVNKTERKWRDATDKGNPSEI